MAPKFALYIDYCVGISPGFEYRDLAAKTLVQAMQEADEILEEKERSHFRVYLIQIMSRSTSASIKIERGLTAHEYKALIEEYASCSWRPQAYRPHSAKRYQNKYDSWYVTD